MSRTPKFQVLDQYGNNVEEPCFVIRGKDALALPVLQEYIDRANAMNFPMPLLRDLIQLSADIKYWQDQHRESVKLAD